ncbi:MAG: YceI family protein [Myxococcota bacterium]
MSAWLSLGLAVMTSTQTSAAGRYLVSPKESEVYVVVKKDRSTLLAGLSHDHVIVAQSFAGFVEWDPGEPSACRVEIVVPVRSLVVDPDGKRESLGFEKELGESGKQKVRDNMLAKSQLFARSFPEIRFEAQQCTVAAEGKIALEGALTIRGVRVKMNLPMKVDFDQDRLRARVDFTRGHEFGFDPYSNALGALKNDEPLRFHVDIVAIREPGSS